MKKSKIAATLCYIAAVLMYIAALFMMICYHKTAIGLILLCGGSAFLCLGGALTQRYIRENQKDKENKK